MAEVDFERRLERLFADGPDFSDSPAFAEGVERRLNRGWTARRWLIGTAGLTGGVIGASQLVLANVADRVESAEQSARVLTAGLSRVSPSTDMVSALSGGYGLWVALGLTVALAAFAFVRLLEEI